MKKALIHEASDARELSMLLMAWAPAVAGRFSARSLPLGAPSAPSPRTGSSVSERSPY